jgi:hypothetical protein
VRRKNPCSFLFADLSGSAVEPLGLFAPFALAMAPFPFLNRRRTAEQEALSWQI